MPVLKQTKHKKHGAFIRKMKKPFAHGRLEETRVDPDSPAAFYYEETKSCFNDCQKARKDSTGANVRWIEII